MNLTNLWVSNPITQSNKKLCRRLLVKTNEYCKLYYTYSKLNYLFINAITLQLFNYHSDKIQCFWKIKNMNTRLLDLWSVEGAITFSEPVVFVEVETMVGSQLSSSFPAMKFPSFIVRPPCKRALAAHQILKFFITL